MTENQPNNGKTLRVLVYLGLWYFISMYYNIYNKRALQELKAPWFVASAQMGLGLPIFVPLWVLGVRPFPGSTLSGFFNLMKSQSVVAFYLTLTHISGVIALGAGSVSFTQVVKAAEPAFTAFVAAVFEHQYFPLPVYLSLIPVMVGVSLSSASELTFSWYCLFAGVLSNIFAAARGVFGKKQMVDKAASLAKGSPENYYAVLTLVSFLMQVPLSLAVEGNIIFNFDLTNPKILSGLQNTFYSGVLFYLYNEVSFKALNDLHPVSHALANTLRRIVIIISSVIVFKNPITPVGIAGCVLAIGGVGCYSLAQYYTKKPKDEKKKSL